MERNVASPIVLAPPDAGAALALESGESTFERLCESLMRGTPWAHALLTAVGEWTVPRETLDQVETDYLIGGEAFDWLLLAERLLRGVPASFLPSDEVERLLFDGVLPAEITEAHFKSALGPEKYRAHLNFFYGVVVEEALWYAVEREVEKERGVRGLHGLDGVQDAIAERLYRTSFGALLSRFQREHGRNRRIKLTLGEWHSFTYWLFKRRLANSDQARIASDTRKGLAMLRELREVCAPLDTFRR